MDDNSKIAQRSPEWLAQKSALELPDTLLGGTAAMRKAGTRYLRKGEAEAQADYDLRLHSTTLADSYSRTLNFLTGQVFSKDVTLEDETQQIVELTDNIDNQGNNLSVFSAKAFRSGLHAGVSFILVDFSKVQTMETEDGRMYFDESEQQWKPRTLAAAQANGWRPYWVLIEAGSVIDIWTDTVNGVQVMTQFRYFEPKVHEKTPWTREVNQDRIRVLRPGSWEVWEARAGTDKKKTWVMTDNGTTGLDVIPVAAFIPGERKSEYTALPALQGLADLCETHWQASSGHRHLMDWVRRPAFFGKMLGMGDGTPVAFGPNRLIESNSPEADLKSVGVDSASVEASQADLQRIESAMSLYGLRLLMPRSGNTTATQHTLESAESDSALKRWAKAFKDCLERCFEFTAMWLSVDIPDAAGAKLNDDFVKIFDADQTRVILEAVAAGLMPKEMAYESLRSILPVRDDLDWQEARAMIEDDARMAGVGQPASAAAIASGLLGQTQGQRQATP